jgi:hypothetical protein
LILAGVMAAPRPVAVVAVIYAGLMLSAQIKGRINNIRRGGEKYEN